MKEKEKITLFCGAFGAHNKCAFNINVAINIIFASTLSFYSGKRGKIPKHCARGIHVEI